MSVQIENITKVILDESTAEVIFNFYIHSLKELLNDRILNIEEYCEYYYERSCYLDSFEYKRAISIIKIQVAKIASHSSEVLNQFSIEMLKE